MSFLEHSACGVGFVASLKNDCNHANLLLGLRALQNLEHRGGMSADGESSDGSGVLTDIPHELLGVTPGDAVANLFLPRDPTNRVRSLRLFEETFHHAGLQVIRYRDVPLDPAVLTPALDRHRPEMLMAIIRRPEQCTSRLSFEKMLYNAKQLTRSRLREAGIVKQFFFTSLSSGTIVYKALTTAAKLAALYPDLTNPAYRTRFVLFHRRFSTNTATAWDTAQPFRVVAHNGEINTISGNRAWAYSRERALGLREDELLTHRGISDSGSVNEILEALFFRSSIPHPEDILAILMPQTGGSRSYYEFWSRAMEPWDGPALFTYSDGRTVGARLDRSGFRPCRWARTSEHFLLSSEAGSFEIPDELILAKGSLTGGGSVSIDLRRGRVDFEDPSRSRENRHATFDPRLMPLERLAPPSGYQHRLDRLTAFGFTDEDVRKIIPPLVREGKEGIGSMGDTARLAVLSDEMRSIFDFFYQRFAQVTNPPLDYLREKNVTEMKTILGRKPNIFAPKELLPLKLGIESEGPVLTLGQMEFLKALDRDTGFEGAWPAPAVLDTTFPAADGAAGFLTRLERLKKEAAGAIKRNRSILILSDRRADDVNIPIPAIFALTAIGDHLTRNGLRLRISFVIDSGEIKEPHHVAVLTAFGAAAVCPYLLLELAREYPTHLFNTAATAPLTGDSADARELRLVRGLEGGVLKIMSKMGISVFKSYHNASLFSIVGLSRDVHDRFFPGHESRVGGLSLEQLIDQWRRNFSATPASEERGTSGLPHNYLYQENPRKRAGERHSMTIARSKIVHRLVTEKKLPLSSTEVWDEYLKIGADTDPISFRHLLKPKGVEAPLDVAAVEPVENILRTFGSGAMSFGAISAEAQRDIILAMREIGGRSNSGEGGENPYYFSEGVSCHTKQVASGRFGVTGEYLVTGEEIQIKMAQGAKPGEGGQLMAVKVSDDIARARHSDRNVDLISPPPMHDIYSIEDLKQLIYELRQLKPDCPVSVKLVAGDNVGTIAVGVAKAGADIIQISGHDGGTGAASLGSMKHAGLPWELGLQEAHRALYAQGLRDCVRLRVDGGLSTGRDIVTAAALGAEEFDFGKLLLVAEGCIMARVCEKNTCPTGIATHDPKFKRLYRGTKDRIVALLRFLAEDVRRQLASVGATTLGEVVGRSDLLAVDAAHEELARERGLDLRWFLAEPHPTRFRRRNPFLEGVSEVNERLLAQVKSGKSVPAMEVAIGPRDRAVLATLNGELAKEAAKHRIAGGPTPLAERATRTSFHFRGSAGQGFGVFLPPGVSVTLRGEANDAVGKSMSGGQIVVTPTAGVPYAPEENTILGNCALYGATGGTLFAHGLAGNRFAVRNSGATAVVEGAGMHACEYMTRGTVVILGACGDNVGAGMTGGVLYLDRRWLGQLNNDYLRHLDMTADDRNALRQLLDAYHRETGSRTAGATLERWEERGRDFVKCLPLRAAAAEASRSEAEATVKAPAAPILTPVSPPEIRPSLS